MSKLFSGKSSNFLMKFKSEANNDMKFAEYTININVPKSNPLRIRILTDGVVAATLSEPDEEILFGKLKFNLVYVSDLVEKLCQ